MPPILLAFLLHFCASGKPVIDTNAIDHWPLLSPAPQISVYGNYLAFTVTSGDAEMPNLTIRARHGDWKREFPGVARCYFSGNEKQAVIATADSLYFIELGAEHMREIKIASYQWPSTNEGHWLAYRQFFSGDLLLYDLIADSARDLGAAKTYSFDRSGHYLAWKDGGNLDWMDLGPGIRRRVWTSNKNDTLRSYCWDNQGRQLAFVVTGMNGGLWNCKPGDSPVKIATGRINGPVSFSRKGQWVFFMAAGTALRDVVAKPGAIGPLIRTWRDQTFARSRGTGPAAYWSVAATDGSRLQRLEDPDQRLLTPPGMVTGDWVLISRDDSYALLSLADGTLYRLDIPGGYPTDFSFSPEGRWFVYYDPVKAQYISIEMSTGIFRTITAGVIPGVSSEFPHGVGAEAVAEPAGWLPGDKAVLLYDNYDLWEVDPGCHRKPVNVTRGYGWKHRVKLRIVEEEASPTRVFSAGDSLLLTGFDMRNKYNGFYRLVLGGGQKPDSLFMGPYTFYRVASQKPHRYSWDDGMRPVRAVGADTWLVRRESAQEAPNYFSTSDFRHFEAVTNFRPQSQYNWLTAELINYTGLDGLPCQGVLYKPENFDSANRYPLLFNIYEQLSHRLYEFPRPELCRDNLNIPWFVSRGYLVFTPDIRYRPASVSNRTIGQWACVSVVAAARYLRSLPFVDSKRLGIQGHSLGAEETNYILTNTSLFAAAAEMAGPTDPVSAYLTLLPMGSYPLETRESLYIWEHGQARIGATLWQRPDLYLRESAVLHANKISTPLLIVHNPRDAAVQGSQGVELFIALRRLAKPVWLLQYPDEDHIILQRRNALDYTQRLTAFFDHFLLGGPIPEWMMPH